MEFKFDLVQPNLLVEGNCVYVNVPRDQVVSLARDVNEILSRNIGALQVRESDVGAVTGDAQKKRSKETIPLSEYLVAFEQQMGPHHVLTTPSHNLFGAGDYLVDAFTLEKGEVGEVEKARGFLKNLGTHVKYIGKVFGAVLSEEAARKHLNERLAKLENGLAERYGSLWMISGLAPSRAVASFYDDSIAVGRVALGSRNENDETLVKTREELVDKLEGYSGERLSFDVPSLMEQAFRMNLDGPALMADYGDVLDNPEWRKRLIMLDD
ncbi:MAG: hypothetical protein KJ600_03400 [Nanoarchaeota archaeon]|nr:hypothetical protein [Nanoarchaeota archaeon]MBU1103573.1 hypothetical protein [Nanoarchaeota archaeon]